MSLADVLDLDWNLPLQSFYKSNSNIMKLSQCKFELVSHSYRQCCLFLDSYWPVSSINTYHRKLASCSFPAFYKVLSNERFSNIDLKGTSWKPKVVFERILCYGKRQESESKRGRRFWIALWYQTGACCSWCRLGRFLTSLFLLVCYQLSFVAWERGWHRHPKILLFETFHFRLEIDRRVLEKLCWRCSELCMSNYLHLNEVRHLPAEYSLAISESID